MIPHPQSRIAHIRWPLGGLRAALISSLVWACSGCGASDGLDRQAISGTVTCDGRPLANGTILFEPATNESGTAVGSTIRQGHFLVSRRDGPVPGFYRVRIYASSGIQAPPTKGQSDRSPRPMVERLPAAFNTHTKLAAEVLARQTNSFRFDLQTRD